MCDNIDTRPANQDIYSDGSLKRIPPSKPEIFSDDAVKRLCTSLDESLLPDFDKGRVIAKIEAIKAFEMEKEQDLVEKVRLFLTKCYSLQIQIDDWPRVRALLEETLLSDDEKIRILDKMQALKDGAVLAAPEGMPYV